MPILMTEGTNAAGEEALYSYNRHLNYGERRHTVYVQGCGEAGSP